ncbi:MAG: FecR domain-containing protein [Betaproteobacteria bacterium]|nr:FecR domain-containing protein [Betaproteobacteria bacterium]
MGLLFQSWAYAEETRFYLHTAQSGDTLIKLADRYLVKRHDWQTLQKLNGGVNPVRLPIGSQIKIPIPAMRSESLPVKVIAAQGDVYSGSTTLAAGSILKEGDRLKTGDDGFVTIQLADGSTLTVQSKSSVQLQAARQLANTGGVSDSIIKLESGRLETTVAKQKQAASRYEVRTPTANMGVRGTVFRAGVTLSGQWSQSEVLEGQVGVGAVNAPNSTDIALNAGFGTLTEAGKAPLAPIALLEAPGLTGLPKRIDSQDFSFALTPIAKARQYRGQLARDGEFKNLLADVVSNEPLITFAGVAEGDYFFRARAIDSVGLEGKDAVHAFRLKKRISPPQLTTALGEPRTAAVLTASPGRFAWAPVVGVRGYRLQVAKDAAFGNKTLDETGVNAAQFTLSRTLQPGDYFWRVASISSDGEEGPFSEAASFSIRPPVGLNTVVVEGAQARFSWNGSADGAYQLQVARDEFFSSMAVDKIVSGSEFRLENMANGFYFARIRTAGEGAAAGPWSEVQRLEVYGRLWWLNILPR